MVINDLIKCEMCNEKINLRIQMGYYDIPFIFYCPKCTSEIQGVMKVNDEPIMTDDIISEINNGLSMIGALISEDDYSDEYYTVEISAEFPTKKIFKDKKNSVHRTPFLRNLEFYSDGTKANEEVRNAMKFAEFIKNNMNTYLTYFTLLRNKKNSIVYPKIERELQFLPSTIKVVKSQMDALMGLHQLFLTISSISSALPKDTLESYSEMGKELIENYLKETIDYIEVMNFDFDLMEKKSLNLISLFSNVYEQLIPVVALKNSDNLDNLDKEIYGIMTTNYNNLTDFYAKSYEWILDNLDLVIALNNIKYRKNYSSCINDKKLENLVKLGSKYQKIDYVCQNETFSKPMESLKNKVRNAIQHYDSEIDYISQQIVFTNSYKGKISHEKMYLIDFASLCLDNFSIIMYLFEIQYTFKKISLIMKGENLTLSNYGEMRRETKQKNKISKKIPRNSPCPCGSGKKYKKCCGK